MGVSKKAMVAEGNNGQFLFLEILSQSVKELNDDMGGNYGPCFRDSEWVPHCYHSYL